MTYITTLILFILSSFTGINDDGIRLDGMISKNEWAGANEYNLSSGGKLYMLRKADQLYLGIKGTGPGWAHVYLHWKDSISVLHASAALGYQVYVQKENWKLQKKFNWEVREYVYDEKLVQKQEAYFKNNGWCANNNNAGDKVTLEFRIDLARFGNDGLRFAALYTADAKALSYYPSTLSDNTLLQDLVSGGNPDNLQFKTADWVKVKQD
jgi:hypothetical protein